MLVELVVGVVESEALGLSERCPLGKKDVRSWIRPRNLVMMTAAQRRVPGMLSVSNVDFVVDQLPLHHNDVERGNGLRQTTLQISW
jgi:hypothetical protein